MVLPQQMCQTVYIWQETFYIWQALSHCSWMDVSERINGLSHVSRVQPRGHLQDVDGGHPQRASTASLRAR